MREISRVNSSLVSSIGRIAGAVAIVVSCGVALSACQAEIAPVTSKSSEILTMSLPADVSAEGVVLAAVLLSTADIEGALAEGLVTPAEIDLAQTAIDDDLLDLWRERAERDLTTQ